MKCPRRDRVLAWLALNPCDVALAPRLYRGHRIVAGRSQITWESNEYVHEDEQDFLWDHEVQTLIQRGVLVMKSTPSCPDLVCLGAVSFRAVGVT